MPQIKDFSDSWYKKIQTYYDANSKCFMKKTSEMFYCSITQLVWHFPSSPDRQMGSCKVIPSVVPQLCCTDACMPRPSCDETLSETFALWTMSAPGTIQQLLMWINYQISACWDVYHQNTCSFCRKLWRGIRYGHHHEVLSRQKNTFVIISIEFIFFHGKLPWEKYWPLDIWIL